MATHPRPAGTPSLRAKRSRGWKDFFRGLEKIRPALPGFGKFPVKFSGGWKNSPSRIPESGKNGLPISRRWKKPGKIFQGLEEIVPRVGNFRPPRSRHWKKYRAPGRGDADGACDGRGDAATAAKLRKPPPVRRLWPEGLREKTSNVQFKRGGGEECC
jgi:hypothetical protein